MSAAPTRVGVIGAGHWGPNLIRNLHESGRSRVVAIGDRDARRLERIAARYPDVSCVPTADAVLERDDLDAVVIATPTSTHHAFARAALERGLHVFVEKPLARTVAEAEDLVALAARAGRVLLVGHVFLFNEGVRAVKERIDAGSLGNVQYVQSVRSNLGPVRTDVSALWDLAAHDVSIFGFWLGGPPLRATGKGAVYLNPGIEDVVFATLEYPGGVLANLHATWLSPRKVRQITVVGDRQMLVVRRHGPRRAGARPRQGRHRPARRSAGGRQLRELSVVDPRRRRHDAARARGRAAARRVRALPRLHPRRRDPGRRPGGGHRGRARPGRDRALAAQRQRRGRAVSVSPPRGVSVHPQALCESDRIGPETRIWAFAHVMAGARIGARCNIGEAVFVESDVVIGDDVTVKNGVALYNGVTLDDETFVGPQAVFTNDLRPRSGRFKRPVETFLPTPVARGATVGANATVLCGHAIGAWGMVAAGAVVVDDVAPHALVAGVPALRVAWVCMCAETLGEDLRCGRCGREYRPTGAGLERGT